MAEQNARLTSGLGNALTGIFKRLGGVRGVVIFALGHILLIFGAVGSSFRRSDSEESLYTDEEARLVEICEAVEGVGRCRVIINKSEKTYREEGRVESVCIVCDGARSATVRQRLTELVSALYGIGTNRIYIARLQ